MFCRENEIRDLISVTQAIYARFAVFRFAVFLAAFRLAGAFFAAFFFTGIFEKIENLSNQFDRIVLIPKSIV